MYFNCSRLNQQTPSRSLGNKSPYELLFHSPPSYAHLKCFGCLCFISTLSHNRDKFAPRARKCVFLGYPHGIKGYKVLDLISNSIHISRNIIFFEHIYPYVLSSQPLTSYVDDMIFPHCTSDTTSYSSSYPSMVAPSSPLTVSSPHVLDTTSSPSAEPIADPIAIPTVDPTAKSPSSISQPVPISSSSSLPITPLPILRRSIRPYNPPPYLSEYSCKSVSTKPNSGLPYDISDCLDYSHLGLTFHSFVMAVNTTPLELASFHQAIQYPKWRVGMDKEIEALQVNNTWTLVPLSPRKCPIGYKWVYRVKYLPDGTTERYKARFSKAWFGLF